MFINSLNKQALKKEFEQAQPFPHLIIDNILQEDKIEVLLEALQKEEFIAKTADLFQLKQTHDLVSCSSNIIKEFRDFLANEFVKVIEEITGLTLKKGVVDLAGTLYQDTDFLLCHDDELDERKIAFLFYLSDVPAKQGGSLNLFNSVDGKPTTIAKKIQPQYNRFACFEVSKISFHEVQEVIGKVNRIAFGGWFHA